MKKILAYCIPAAAQAIKSAVGVVPLTSPPRRALDATELSGNDFVYIRLHGVKSIPGVWFGEDENGAQSPALTVEDVLRADMRGSVVLAASCYGAQSDFPEAFYAAGASLVIAGDGPNLAAGNRVIGADLLARFVWGLLNLGAGPSLAFNLSRAALSLTAYRAADRDAAQFKTIKKG